MLNELIDAHKKAMADFAKACERLDEVTNAYEKSQENNRVTVKLYNNSHSVDGDRVWLEHHVDNVLRESRRQLPFITAMSPEFAVQFSAFLDETQKNLNAKIDNAIEEEERRKEAFGLTAARLHFDETSLAEKEAVSAICAYRCSTLDEERGRLEYIMHQPEIMQMIDDFTPMLMQAVAA